MKAIFPLVVVALLAIIAISQIKEAACQSNIAAANVASQAANSDKRVGQPTFAVSASGGGNNGRNWNAAGNLGVGTKVWESQNGRHAIGAGANVGQATGRFQGQSWKSHPDVGVGAGYRYRFGK